MMKSEQDTTFGMDFEEHFLDLSRQPSDYALFIVGRDGLIRGWNSGAARLYGYESKEIVGRLFSELFSIDDAMQGFCDQDLSEANDNGSSARLMWQTRKNGSTFHCNANITAIMDEEGEVRSFAIVVQDRHPLPEAHGTGEMGCEFVLQLPLCAAPATTSSFNEPQMQYEVRRSTQQPIKGSLRVMLITDQLDYGSPLSRLLNVNGCVVNWLRLPQNLDHEVRAFNPKIVLLDMGMTLANPFDIAAQLNNSQTKERLQLIALTDGDAIDSDVARGRNSSIQSFVAKSDDFGKLRSALDNAMHSEQTSPYRQKG